MVCAQAGTLKTFCHSRPVHEPIGVLAAAEEVQYSCTGFRPSRGKMSALNDGQSPLSEQTARQLMGAIQRVLEVLPESQVASSNASIQVRREPIGRAERFPCIRRSLDTLCTSHITIFIRLFCKMPQYPVPYFIK